MMEKRLVGRSGFAHDHVVEPECHAAGPFDARGLLEEQRMEGADRLHREASHVEPEIDLARNDRDVGGGGRIDDAAREDEIFPSASQASQWRFIVVRSSASAATASCLNA